MIIIYDFIFDEKRPNKQLRRNLIEEYKGKVEEIALIILTNKKTLLLSCDTGVYNNEEVMSNKANPKIIPIFTFLCNQQNPFDLGKNIFSRFMTDREESRKLHQFCFDKEFPTTSSSLLIMTPLLCF